jgi:hypothetical protein
VPIVGELRQVLPALTEKLRALLDADRVAAKDEWRDQVLHWRAEHPFRYRPGGAGRSSRSS